MLVDRRAELLAEGFGGAQQPGIDELEQIPQLAQVILHGRSGGDHLEAAVQSHRGARTHRQAVLDRLRLVQHDHLPSHLGQQVDLLMQQAVAGDDEVEGPGRLQFLCTIARAQHGRPQSGRESTRLIDPIGAYRSRSHDQRRALGSAGDRHSQRLQRLAKTHVVSQAGARAPSSQPCRPAVPLRLVLAEVGLDCRGKLRIQRQCLLKLPHAVGPSRVRVHGPGVIHQSFQSMGAGGMKAHALSVAVHISRQFLDMAAKAVAQSDEVFLPQLHEAARGVLHVIEQLAQGQHQPGLEFQLAVYGEPIAPLTDLEREVVRSGPMRNSQRLALRPGHLDRIAEPLQLVHQFQALERIRHVPPRALPCGLLQRLA